MTVSSRIKQKKLVINLFRITINNSVAKQNRFSVPDVIFRNQSRFKEGKYYYKVDGDSGGIHYRNQIGDKRQATVMATASKAVREKEKPTQKLGESKKYATLLA